MNKHIVASICGALLITCAFSAEQSAFGAGDLESSSPYGLTQSEKVLLKNKKSVDNLGQNVSSVKMQVGTIEEQIDGIRSVLDGTNERVNQMDRRLRELESASLTDENVTNASQDELEKIRAYVKKTKRLQDANNRKIKKVIKQLSVLIDNINSNYVSREELNRLLAKESVSPSNKAVKKSVSKQKPKKRQHHNR